ncbi:hypothetical protein [Psychroserpens sp. Hel_I_66]|uniref:hypothetical protein n=1 Tax=Psychroserpens sp. Hel_I_66 TaxID=1250004 RepID=UPI00064716D9|nr:hypothetical protein [Psychroserpens sp. Hel_I_66]
MKLMICVLIMLISAKECDKENAQLATQDTTTEGNNTTVMSQKSMQIDRKITYQAVSRGFFLNVTVQGDSISFSNERDMKSVTTYKIPKEEKEELVSLISSMEETTLPDLKAPSKKHQFDGAAIATVEVENGENSYKTVAFDHGTPPESIKPIVEKMLSIKTMIEKQ